LVKRTVGAKYSEADIRPWEVSMPLRSSTWRRGLAFVAFGAGSCLLALLGRARATDEIQLYDASIADVGQWTILKPDV
jgi:hypothetical protein